MNIIPLVMFAGSILLFLVSAANFAFRKWKAARKSPETSLFSVHTKQGPIELGSDQPPSPETIAYVKALRAACPGAEEAFLYSVAEAGVTLYSAAKAWSATLIKRQQQQEEGSDS